MQSYWEYSFFMVMFSVGAALCLVTLIYIIKQAVSRQGGEVGGWELRGARQRIAAIMRTTLAEGLRARIASGFALLIIVSIPLFFFTASGDGTIKGQVQMFLAYSMGLTGILLAVLTILFSCRSLSNEIATRQIYGIASKPVPRWQIIAGKWLGVMVLNLVILALAATMTYAGTRLIVADFKKRLEHELATYGSMTPQQAGMTVAALADVRGVGKTGMESPIITAFSEQLGKTREEVGELLLRLPEQTRVNLRRFDELRRQVLVARTTVPVSVPDLSADVESAYQALAEERRLPTDWTDQRIRRQIESELTLQYCSLGYGESRTWRIQGPSPQPGREWVMSLRFKVRAPRQPLATQFEGGMLETDNVLLRWGLGDPSSPNFLMTQDQYPINTFNEIEIPQVGVEKDGTVIVSLLNVDPRRLEAVIDLPGGAMSVLYRVGSQESALIQSALAMLIPLACLAAFGVCASTFLSFPVGVLIVLTLYVISSSMGFVAESLAVTQEYLPPEHDRGLAFELRRVVIEGLGWILSIGDLDPVNRLMDGQVAGWAMLGLTAAKFVIAKGLVVMLIAVLVFRRRELAAVIV